LRILNFGSINIDYIYRVPHLARPGETLVSKSLTRALGGKGANQSIALASAGASVLHLGHISATDSWAIDIMHHAGVNTSLITQTNRPSGHAIIQLDSEGENTTILIGGANQEFTENSVYEAIDQLSSNDWLLLQNECNQADKAIAYASKKNKKIAFNPSPITPDVLKIPLQNIALLFVNPIELQALSQQPDATLALNQLTEQNPGTRIIVNLGRKGVLMAKGAERQQVSAPSVKVADTSAAGDTFLGYYLAAQIAGHSENHALAWACHAAALATTKIGASSSIPIKKDVDAMYDK
jgi:ribokinase